ncbi:hypothetical protein EMCG_01634 [[Emmonsia] crescens]|uniref:Uncharacterized protein n=1 Tax=[Emmonsia] crescens TaxID=73230 RepID=A0A0G2I1N0_9EURO|nr:hypothetical protein EMCG_01634 [Emmonsia crescens UAMH 3008]
MNTWMKTDNGWVMAWTLLNSGANANFISHTWANQYFANIEGKPRMVEAVDGHKINSYSQLKALTKIIDDSNILQENVYQFEEVDACGYDVILGMPWLETANPDKLKVLTTLRLAMLYSFCQISE